MRCPTLADLPSPPVGKTGWPWTEETPRLPMTMPNGSSWPKISIITPSYNQAQFVEETIRSVLLQGYPNLEYLVMDGGSEDESAIIISRYAPWLAYWTSQKDNGQASAINKGFERCSGDLIGWLNSDDTLLPGVLGHFGKATNQYPDSLLAGNLIVFRQDNQVTHYVCQENITLKGMIFGLPGMKWNQPGTYVPRIIAQQAGPLDESLRYIFDKEWMCRLLNIASVHYLHIPVARFRLHAASKTCIEAPSWMPEHETVISRYWDIGSPLEKRIALARLKLGYAAVYLSVTYWNLHKGRAYLWEAMCRDMRIMILPRFWELLIRSMLPLSCLRFVRRLLLR